MAIDTHLVYVGDPMCSWCWGFAPELDTLVLTTGLPVQVIVGGLRPGPAAQPLDERMRRFLQGHWDHIAELTGQPFDARGLDREDWVYDTELPAIAVAVMRRDLPERTLEFFVTLQRAFYADAVDITDPAVYEDILEDFGVDAGAFVAAMTTEEARGLAWEDFASARRLGVTGFPTLLLHHTGRLSLLAAGYRPAAEIESFLAAKGIPSGVT